MHSQQRAAALCRIISLFHDSFSWFKELCLLVCAASTTEHAGENILYCVRAVELLSGGWKCMPAGETNYCSHRLSLSVYDTWMCNWMNIPWEIAFSQSDCLPGFSNPNGCFYHEGSNSLNIVLLPSALNCGKWASNSLFNMTVVGIYMLVVSFADLTLMFSL